jgi:hypothetical protein
MEALHEKLLIFYLIEVWQVVCDGVDFPDEDEEPTSNQLQHIHRNAQAISILTSSIEKEEFNRVDGLDAARMFRQLFEWPMKDPSP